MVQCHVCLIDKVKIQHHLPGILRRRRGDVSIQPAIREWYPGIVYNELFRALASQGRDAEFLSLWEQGKSCISRIGAILSDFEWVFSIIGIHINCCSDVFSSAPTTESKKLSKCTKKLFSLH